MAHLSHLATTTPPELKRAGDEDVVTILPQLGDSTPGTSSAPFFFGGRQAPAVLSSDSAAITLLIGMRSTRLEAQTRAIYTLLLQHRRLDPQDEAVLSLHRMKLVVKFVRRPAHLAGTRTAAARGPIWR
ncbi:MAG: hypothetical protein GPOALKHO_000200 [Sodalis sp.]|nr:MAG: hypothetical protein GPOALKHO_000200 [Sodalis sp.]